LVNHLKFAEKLFMEGRLEEARGVFEQILEQEPQNAEVLNNLGVICFQTNQTQKAWKYIEQSLGLKPDYFYALDNLIRIAEASGKFAELIPLLHTFKTHVQGNRQLTEFLGTVEKRATIAMKKNIAPLKPVIFPDRPFPQQLKDCRILNAPFEIAGNMGLISRKLKARGLNVTSVNYYDSWLKYQCDLNLKLNNQSAEKAKQLMEQFAAKAKGEYDIFHFHFLHSLYPDLRELDELKQRGKKIIFSFWGSDQRSPEWVMYQQARFLGYRPPKPYFLTRELYLKQKKINQYADVMFGITCIPRGLRPLGFAETEKWSLEEKKRIQKKYPMHKGKHKVIFLHAPTNNFKKGSAIIMNLLKECQNEGMPLDMMLVSGKEPKDAKRLFAHADFAIDQLGAGTFGLFGLEMMCWQIPVLVYQTKLFDDLRGNPPVIHVTKDNFRQQIAACIEMKKSSKYGELTKKARHWAMRNADIEHGIDQYIYVYRELQEGRRVPQYVNPAWFREEQRMQKGIKSEFYRYMDENRVFDEIGMRPKQYDKQLYF